MPIFDLDNAVQQGWNRDYSNNDWNVEARNIEIVLEDNAGAYEFRIHDSDNVAVVVADSDGYLSVNGNAEVHGGNLLVEHRTDTNIELITLKDSADQAGVFIFDTSPDGVVTGQKASIGLEYGDGYFWINRDGATDWDRLVYRYEIDTAINNEIGTVTLQRAYDNDPDGGDVTITTNSTDGAIIIAGDQKLQVTATGGFDLDTGFDMDGSGPFDVDITGAVSIDSDAASNFTVAGADLTLSTTTSGDVKVVVPAAGSGDFTVDDGTSTYLQTDTANYELLLGYASPTTIDVRVLKDLIVDGDLTVNGTETIINTEDLFVEDNMIRININAAPTFNGVTGVEAEVGSDGYVEWHWDDSQTRWEISIDRNTTPGSQTFRPLPYLADAAATLDLSSTGDGGYPTAGPNATAGASVINTNATNFPYTFGPDMADNSVQAALEAIDGYFIEVREDAIQSVTLQVAYDNDADGGNATITTNATDGAVVIAGDQKLQITATNGLDLDTGFDMDGSGPFDVDITGAVSIDADAYSNFLVQDAGLVIGTVGDAGVLNLLGQGGIVLDGTGDNVIPADSCTDSLGDSTHGWSTIWICNGAGKPISIKGVGQADAPNTESGASLIGTDADNFYTFGPDMTDDTVQAALEAADGYMNDLGIFIHNVDDDVTALETIFNDMNEPNGFVNRTDSTVTWSDVNRRLTIQPTSTSYDIYIADLGKVTKSATETVDITDTEGLWYIYFDGSATIQASQTWDNRIITEWAFIAVVYWNADDNQEELFGDERHGITMDGATHSYLHNVLGAQWSSGLGLGNLNVDGDGTNNNQAQFLVGDGIFYDEDIKHTITDDTPQALDPLATLPIYYKESAAADWRRKTADTYPVIQAGSVSGYAGSLIAWNENTGSTWQLTEISDDGYMLMHYFATNDFNEPVIGICGENEYASVSAATAGIIDEFNNLYISGLPGPEFAPLATVIWHASSTYSNTPKAIIVSDDNGDEYTDWRLVLTDRSGASGQAISDHGNLSGLGDDDHIQYLLANGTRSLTAAWDAAFAISTPEINYTGNLSLDGSSGITLEGNGGDVVPGTSCQDSLGDATTGWTDIYLCDGSSNVIALSDVGSASTPNTSSGAYLVGTDADNFTATFGGDMTSDTVQSALEAIDGYLQELTVGFSTVTLQIAYKNDADGSDAVITTDSTDGAVVIAGTEKLQVTATNGFDLDTGFDMDGSGPFDVDITGAVSIDADAASNFSTSSGAITIDGGGGIVLEGNGSDVIPGTSCQDSLGDATTGWTDIYLCDGSNNVIALGSAGAAGTPNVSSGAYLVGTDADNFSTYGSYMTSDSVQSALEAIDGYFVTIRDDAIQSVTLQVAYDNDTDGGDATITTNATDGAVVIAGDQKLQVTATGGFDLDTGFDMDGAGSFDVDITGAVSIDADAYSNFLVQDAGLVVGTVGDTGTLNLIGQSGIVLDGTGNNVIPADSCTDSLGDSTHGWSTIYLCNGNNTPISIGSAGTSGTPNITSGASVVGTDADNFATYGSYMTSDTVQSALEAIDGYLQDLTLEGLDTTYTKEIGLDIDGGVKNGNVKILNVSGTAALDFKFATLSRSQWTIPVPSDWDGISDIVVEVIWSPDSTDTGNVEWRLEYKSLALTELASTAATTDDYAQAGGGTANAIQSTGSNLSIAAGDISTTDEIIVINIVRRGSAGSDTFAGDAQIHLVKYVYTAQNIV